MGKFIEILDRNYKEKAEENIRISKKQRAIYQLSNDG